ncbi:phage structural protein [Geomicrobium sediminis]|uniref:DUF3277 domain-containing protein n=1 Tax=Geomicrobium sediminis TaxID=1347788 RepID=A0ABS2PGZ4_9BACL|nr:phage protein [Geomicrobium sediminis]MBM7634078.1 hypothetical protein [Geomicrobium sediminis]
MTQVMDPKDCQVIVDTTYITGFAEGSVISAEQNEDRFTVHTGAQGEKSLGRSHDETGVITLHLASTSPSLAFLNELYKQGEPFPISCTNARTGEFVGGDQAILQKPPGKEWGSEVADRDVEITVLDYREE